MLSGAPVRKPCLTRGGHDQQGGRLFRIATGSGREAVTAAIFWLKVRAGWREPLGVREYLMGKKEARELAAKNAAVGTEWEDLLERHAALTASDVEYQ